MATHEISRQNGDIEPKTSTMATPLPDPIVYNPTLHTHFLHQVAAIHASCILVDHTMATFLPPLSHAKILASWETWSSQVEAGQRVILLQLARTGDGEETVAGAVSLYCPETETGSHRGEVGRLLVSPDFRYRGIARKLMEALEKVAVERGRWLIMLDTTIGSGAEHVYPKLGYKEVGVIPRYGYSPDDRRLRDEVFFYKDLKHGDD